MPSLRRGLMCKYLSRCATNSAFAARGVFRMAWAGWRGDSRLEALETPYGDGFFFGYAEGREARDEFETSFISELMPGWE